MIWQLRSSEAPSICSYLVISMRTTTIYDKSKPNDDKLAILNNKEFWKVIEDNNATYFCGHEHIFNVSQPTIKSGGKAYQVMVGSGGSPFDDNKTPKNDPDYELKHTYAWANVSVRASGKVHIDFKGFDENYGPTKTIGQLDIDVPQS